MRNDNAYLEDIRLACERISRYVEGVTQSEFLAAEKTRAAVEREITIMGEAAGNVSQQFKSNHSELPWARLIRLRNFYIHGYDRLLSPAEVWGTAIRLAPRVGRHVAPLIDDGSRMIESSSSPIPKCAYARQLRRQPITPTDPHCATFCRRVLRDRGRLFERRRDQPGSLPQHFPNSPD